MNTDAMPTSDIDAEKFTLAAMMQGPQAIAEVAEIVSPGDFYRPLHQVIYRAMIMMFAAGEPVSPVTLRAWLDREAAKYDPVYLVEIYGLPSSAAFGVAHARIVWEHSVRRHIGELGDRLSQMSGYLSESPADLLGRAHQMINQMSKHATPDEGHALNSAEFMAQTGRATEPVIPGLLDHQDRVIIVGGEGTGKTTLAFQVGFALAAGQHPFFTESIKPGKVLIVDLENPVEILKRRVAKLRDTAERFEGWHDRNLTIWARPGGVDLTNPAQAFRLAEVIRREQPDLLICGPLYKTLPGTGEVSEYQHTAVCRFFDQARARYDCAVWLETHAPMQSSNGERALRPLGSGVYSRWPEFGISLTRNSHGVLTLARFRGDREENRAWPAKLTRSPAGWPWAAIYPPGTFT